MASMRWPLLIILICAVIVLIICLQPTQQGPHIIRPIPEAVEWVEPVGVPEERPVVKSTKRLPDDPFEDEDAFFEEPKPRHCEPNFARRFFMVGPCYR